MKEEYNMKSLFCNSAKKRSSTKGSRSPIEPTALQTDPANPLMISLLFIV